eukprot:5342692-Alexandrium_andersonii.AAC.1
MWRGGRECPARRNATVTALRRAISLGPARAVPQSADWQSAARRNATYGGRECPAQPVTVRRSDRHTL